MSFTLKNWSITLVNPSPYLAPELRQSALQGECEGKFIKTSGLRGKTEDNHVLTKNSTYILGEIDPLYEKAFPNARERLLSSLPTL